MNPTNYQCPSDIARFVQTDYRPSKSLYVNVYNNNNFRYFLQRNAESIRRKNLQNYVDGMYCSCEPHTCSSVQKYNWSLPIRNKKISYEMFC